MFASTPNGEIEDMQHLKHQSGPFIYGTLNYSFTCSCVWCFELLSVIVLLGISSAMWR